MVNDWAPGIEAEIAFKTRFIKAGGDIVKLIRIPLANPDFAPFLQRVRDLKPDTAFIYFPGPEAGIFAKQFAERGLANSGIKLIGPGDLTDDDGLNAMGDQMLGMITAGRYSAGHDSLHRNGRGVVLTDAGSRQQNSSGYYHACERACSGAGGCLCFYRPTSFGMGWGDMAFSASARLSWV